MNLFTHQEQQNLASRFPEFRMLFLETLDSTQMECQRQWAKEPFSRWLVVANQQTSGRGRYGRQWQSPPDTNLYVSWVQPNPCKKQIGLLNLLCGILVYRTLHQYYTTALPNLTLKWPNDIFYADKKIGGILLQNLDAEFSQIIVGIGINVHATVAQIPDIATSLTLAGADPKPDARSQILQRLLENFRNTLSAPTDLTPQNIYDEFSKYSQRTRQYPYTYSCHQYYYTGKLQELHQDGTATIMTEQGLIVHLTT